MVSGIKIAGVSFREDFQIVILLNNSHSIVYNLKPKLVTARFKGVGSWDVFCAGKVVGGNRIVWENNIEVSLDEILTNVTKKTDNYRGRSLAGGIRNERQFIES